MHSTAFQAINYNAVYLPFHIQPEQLPQLLSSFQVTGVQGFNVTVPYKEKIIPHLDWISPQAQLLGSVNTVVYQDGQWKGYTTDGNGFIRSLEAEGISLKEKHITMLGAGGSAKSIAVALLEKDIGSLTIHNRTQNKADKLISILKKFPGNISLSSKLEDHQSIDVLINTTSVGMLNDQLPVSPEVIKKSDFIVDIIYNPPKTSLLKLAESNGKKTQNGLGMLLYQGVEAFEIWTQKAAPVETMKRALLDSINSLNA